MENVENVRKERKVETHGKLKPVVLASNVFACELRASFRIVERGEAEVLKSVNGSV